MRIGSICFLLSILSCFAYGQETLEVIVPQRSHSDDTPFMVVEDMPYLASCAQIARGTNRNKCTMTQIDEYIAKQSRYPNLAKEEGVQGMVFVQFVVGRTGNVEDVEILRPLHPALDEEAIRVVKLLPKFEPGKQLGKEVRVKYSIAVSFTLKK